ncbi:type II toxin-antitoxin system VapC family toxin [Ramlibacter tataouinensis]|uniref:type II toxin-antitoxin system VapC family toxin n=1 Tax=Ramlibacter tataouinensis TaxID=94132 RepID=UPI001D04D843|nr:type II toxin-antitoxin system VapC family toxin [Ramlibacter tataouinensis]
MRADALIERHAGRRVYFDTNIFIYVLGASQRYAALCLELLQACARQRILGCTGDVTLAELLVKPLQANDAQAVAAVRELLVEDGSIALHSHSRKAFERAAALRARHGLKMVHALQLATALEAGATCLVSNDRQFPSLADIECLSLETQAGP